MSELAKAVIATQDAQGRVLYTYGFVDPVDGISYDTDYEQFVTLHDGRRRFRVSACTTTVSWAYPPTQAYHYPTDADFAERLPAAQRPIGPGTIALGQSTKP